MLILLNKRNPQHESRLLKSQLKLLSIMQTSDIDYAREEDLTLEK